MSTERPILRTLRAALAVVLPATLLALLADVLLGYSLRSLGGPLDLLLALLFGAGALLALALPVALGGGLLLGALISAFDPLAGWRRAWAGARAEQEADARTGALLLGLPAGLAVLVVGMTASQAGWVANMANPRLAALATGVLAVLWLLPAGLCVAPATLLARALLRRLPGAGPRRTVAALVLLGAAAGAAGVGLVLRVDLEVLPLRPLAALAVLTTGLVGLGSLLARRQGGAGLARLTRPAALVTQVAISVALLGTTLAAFGASSGPAKAILSGRTLGRRIVLAGRALLDRDGDGHSAMLGGGDCDDSDPAVHPGAAEIPGDGVDNNCFGGDAPAQAAAVPPAAAPGGAPPAPASGGQAAASHVPGGPGDTTGAAGASVDGGAASTGGPDGGPPTGAASAAAAQTPDAPAVRARNVILLLVDTVRADHLGAYGYKVRATSPNMDALAEQSVLFERCYAQAPHTPRSIPSLMVSRVPSHISWRNPTYSYPYLKPDNVTLAEVVADAGIRTGLAASHFYFGRKYGILQGFKEVDNRGAKTLAESNKDTSAPRIFRRLTKRLESLKQDSDAGKRFMLFVHLAEPHSTYMLHKPPSFFGKGWMEKYDGEIHFVDRYVGKIMERLEELGLDQDTAVLLFSDHGEGNGEHGFKWHGQHIYNEVTHVPLLVRAPGARPRRVATPVGLIDIAPTTLELLGLPAQATFEGRSLVPALRGAQLPTVPVFSQLLPYTYCKEEAHALVQGDWKLHHHRTNNTWALFNVAQDPLEGTDLLDREPARAEALRTQLMRWLETPAP